MNKHTVTFPDGSTARRNSQGHKYSHVVVAVGRTNDTRRHAELQVKHYQRKLDEGKLTPDQRHNVEHWQARYQHVLDTVEPDQFTYRAKSWASTRELALKRATSTDVVFPVDA